MKAGELNFFAELLTTTGYNKYYQHFVWATESECEKFGNSIIELNQAKEFILVLSTEDYDDGNVMPIHVHYYFKDFIAKQSAAIEKKLLKILDNELSSLPNEQLVFQVPFLMGYINHMIFQAEHSEFSYKNILQKSLKITIDRLVDFRRNYLPDLTSVQISVPLPESQLTESLPSADTPQIIKVAQGFRKGNINNFNYDNGVEALYWALRGKGMIPLTTSKPAFRHLFFGNITEKVDWLRPINQLRYLIRSLIQMKLINGKKRWDIAPACFLWKGQVLEAKNFHRTSDPEVADDIAELEEILNSVRDTL